MASPQLRFAVATAGLFALGAGADAAAAEDPRFPLAVAVGTHSLTVPWHLGPATTRLNPVVVLGSEHTVSRANDLRLFVAIHLGFFQHYWWMTSVFVDPELGVGFELPLGLRLESRLGVGYQHSFWRRKSLQLEGGRYAQSRDWGKPSLRVPFSVVLGYRGNSTQPLAVSPFVSVQWAVQGLFLDEIPALSHLFFLAGARIDLGRLIQTVGG